MNATISTEPLEEMFRQLMRCDGSDSLFWNTMHWDKDESKHETLTFRILANDLFAWATSDSVEVNDGNIDLLKESIDDLEEIGGHWMAVILAPDLFCCRAEKIKPQRPWFPSRRKYLSVFGGEKLEFTSEQVDMALTLFDVEGWAQY